MKSVLIIGMGRFGRHMAQKLYDLGHDVLAIEILPTKALLTH